VIGEIRGKMCLVDDLTETPAPSRGSRLLKKKEPGRFCLRLPFVLGEVASKDCEICIDES